MISGIGVDIVQIKRIKLIPEFINKILHPEEIRFLKQIQTSSQQQQFVAGRWALKEAIYKAINNFETPWVFSEINIQLINKKLQWVNTSKNSWLSISHETEYAVALAILMI